MLEDIFPRYEPGQQEATEILTLHQMAQDFRLEADYREQLERHQHWYRAVCEQHQQELAAMADELDILDWFRQIWRTR